MKEYDKLKLILAFTIVYLIGFIFLAVSNNNLEFFYYALVIVVLICFLVLYHKQINLSVLVAFGLSLVGFLHLAGGNFHINGIRLYDYWIIQDVFKVDNLVHIVGSFVATLFVFNFFESHFDKKFRKKKLLLGIFLLSAGFGIAAFNEVIELIAVLYFNAQAAVGDYLNNAFDLLYNFIGALIATLILVNLKIRKAFK